GDIRVYGKGRWEQGYWNVTLVRALVTGNPDDKAFHDQGLYNLGFAVHRDATGSRWHYVSLPCTLGLGRDADIAAVSFTGESPQWTDTWKEIKLFYPGQVNWPYLTSRAHAGSVNIAEGVPVHSRHSEVQLALYGVEREFNSEIIRQWIWTLVSGLVLMMALGIGLSCHLGRHKGGVR
ncbi:MAG: ethylbenzene dehydrogenase-related protein, partial [Desulfomonilia bacterium]|nr:ethylbenzene dehydrogenase-related protein [Desulfomonilia bacterium]